MPLTLELVGQKAAHMGRGARKTFQSGGSIGRLPDNDWVLPDDYISGHHAKILFANGKFAIEDTSTNGVFINSKQNRLPRGQPYTLCDGDTIYIDDYEMRVSLAAPPADSGLAAPRPSMADDPFLDIGPDAIGAPDDTDPLKLLGLDGRRPVSRGPTAASLANESPMSNYYRPPSTAHAIIPDDYDPFAPEVQADPFKPSPSSKSSTQSADVPAARQAPLLVPPKVQEVPVQARQRGEPLSGRRSPAVNTPRSVEATTRANVRPASNPAAGLDFAAMLAAAGLDEANVTPELAEQFGNILRVVVSGTMDVLRARDQIKNEFRMRTTTFKPADNNPLKFSANVEHALNNLLVNHNAAFLGPVEAFEDAFEDVRHHQMAMLAGMRVAYAAMLATFEPERLQQEFERHTRGGSFLSGPAKLKFWDLYCQRFHDIVKDADSSFRMLFGDEFAKAYEAQLASLKSVNRADGR